jgi:indole-3-glycerol phosphate synthase
VSRFSQAISEGDGISVIPVLDGDVEGLAALAQEAGAEAIMVRPDDVERVRSRCGLPIVARDGDPRSVSAAGGDALILAYEAAAEDGELEGLYGLARELGLDCPVDVQDEEALEEALERVDPDIVVISERGLGADEEDLERTLDLLADVPAGKLVVSDARIVSREQVLALERAGVDAILVRDLGRDPDFAAALEELVRGPEAPR